MIRQIKEEILKHGDRAEIVSIKCLEDIKKEIENLNKNNPLNSYQKYITEDFYMLDLPKVDFDIRSIIIVASPSPAMVKVNFNWKEKKKFLILPSTYMDNVSTPVAIEEYLNKFLKPKGYNIKNASKLPKKLLAVKSGLGLYGRNNLCYVEGKGSFVNLILFFSDVPCKENNLQEIGQMDLCKSCKACLSSCPTSAIREDRFLIDNERCLTYFNEGGGEFPGWIDESSHNCIYGCMRCQNICPKNKQYLNNIVEPVEFTEEEVLQLLEGKSAEGFSDKLIEKLELLNMIGYLEALPRNLKILLDREG